MYSIFGVDSEAFKTSCESVFDIMDNDVLAVNKVRSDFSAVRSCILFLDKFSQQKTPFSLLTKNRQLSAFGQELLQCTKSITAVNIKPQAFIYNPVVHLFADFITLHRLHDELEDLRWAPERGSLLLGHLEHLKEDLNSPDTHKAIKHFKRGPAKNYKALEKYVDGLFARYARLLVIRVDLAFLEAERDSVSLQDMVKYREQLLGDRRNSAFLKDAVGYAWSLEYAEKTGYHYHLVCFYDGSKHREDITIGFGIGEQWEAITQGKGRFYVCNAQKPGYRFCGIGAVDYHDDIKREYLRKALAYLTKPQLFAKVANFHHSGVRTFGKGVIPKGPRKPGRPRGKSDRVLPQGDALQAIEQERNGKSTV
ncbi:YagK/YfjJ domain-containing protein [Aeromonas encheleia]|uniref:Inovirus Gp2 family protein n=1 Tax=Aeromonas encheleia TaxID=73010 RepID=A0AAE9MJ60_9GAMM|nr:inovirus-type Gp2 protein [Aeromonas encheleia]USV58780.1 inovirus Gp2 family protein [Aeromonas encheleia]